MESSILGKTSLPSSFYLLYLQSHTQSQISSSAPSLSLSPSSGSNPTTSVQAVGIALTFFGLYLYDRTSDSNKADRKARMMGIEEESLLLKTRPNIGDLSRQLQLPLLHLHTQMGSKTHPLIGDGKNSDTPAPGRPRRASNSAWLPPGTRQEETWRPTDLSLQGVRAVT
jgi:solute carrier family 35, member E1